MRTRLDGGVNAKGALMLRCLYCGDNWPETPEFWRWSKGKRLGRKCLACTAEARRHRPTVCALCLTVRTRGRECHGCARRIVGPLTVARLAEYGLVPRGIMSGRASGPGDTPSGSPAPSV